MSTALPSLSIALLGNPNCGKTTLFNALTGSRQHVGNWPGVTVEKKAGSFSYQGRDIEVTDLPGVYALDIIGEGSLDERITRDFALSGEADLIVNIVDASNLERNLYLTAELLEMRVPLLLALNMCDVAEENGVTIDCPALSRTLGCPVLAMSASRGAGIVELKEWLANADAKTLSSSAAAPNFPEALEQPVARLKTILSPVLPAHVDSAWAARKALEGDSSILQTIVLEQRLCDEIERERLEASNALNEEIDIVAANARYAFIHDLISASVKSERRAVMSFSDRVDRIALNRILGIPIFFAMMYLMFMFSINLGGAFIDFFDGLAELLFVKSMGHLLLAAGAPIWLKTLLADGIGGGIQTVASFIPIIGALFLFLSFLEDSGYMARAAFVMDRFMNFIGLPGKSFVPLIVGFGCNVPAVMASRTLESERDRLMTIAMTPFMSCGARLPVYMLFAVAFFPHNGQNLVFALYLIGILAAVLTGLVIRRTLLPGHGAPFIMELPSYHLPTFRGMLIHAWNRLAGFIIKAGKIIVPMVMILNMLNAMGTDGSFGKEDGEESLLAAISKEISPLFAPFGVTQENWPAAVGVFTGMLAKEAVIGTLNALYSQAAENAAAAANESDEGKEENTEVGETFNFWQSLKEVAATVPEALGALPSKVPDPLGISIGETEDMEKAAEEQEINVNTFSVMQTMFGSTAAAFSYLLLVLLYFPCVAVLGAIRKEVGIRWMSFVAAWNTALGFGVATVCYQSLTFSAHPLVSILWFSGISVAFLLAFLAMRQVGKRQGISLPRLEPKAQVS